MLFIVFFIISLCLHYLDFIISVEWIVYELNSINLKFVIIFDWISLLFISFILLISSMIILYRLVYIKMDKYLSRFNYLLILFISSIMLIVLRPNIIRILVGWDGLGIVSYCLIIYYQSYNSYNSGIVTVLCNRIGDIGILITISIMIVVGRWDLFIFIGRKRVILLIVLAAITKSAQIPFSVWLPLAIAAPTPVSALVHSSTLVTAGVYLLIRFNKFLIISDIRFILMFLSVITIFISGIIANFENDFKKIIALSTLRQLGFIMIILRLGYRVLAYYHLLVHAIFKSILFISAGIVIHIIKSRQDIRLLGNLNEIFPFVMIRIIISNMALMGVPFISGFYRKDLIIEIIYMENGVNVFMLLIIVISLLLTVSYSIRFFYYLFFNGRVKFYRYVYVEEDAYFNLSMIMIIFIRIMLGSILNWIFYHDCYFIYIPLLIKSLTLISCLIGVVLLILVIIFRKFICIYYYIYFYTSMWFLRNLYRWVYKPVNEVRLVVFSIDKSWVEFIRKFFIIRFVENKFYYIYNKLYIFMFIFIFLTVNIVLFI